MCTRDYSGFEIVLSGFFGSVGIWPNHMVTPEMEEKAREVMNVLEIVRKEFSVDNSRTYLMGHSMGGAGTLYLGSKYPSNWAAIAAIAPAAFAMQANAATLLTPVKDTMPVMITQGDADTAVPVQNTRAWIAAMNGLKTRHVNIPHCRRAASNSSDASANEAAI